MILRGFRNTGFALLAGCALSLVSQSVVATDGFFVSSAARDSAATESAPYDSEYAAAARELGTAADTPEADARPGEYYFLQGAHAFLKKDYAFAIQMYQIAASWAYKPAEYNLGVMYARGQGVPVDLPRGMAWMALAAERNEQRYVGAREAIYAEVTQQQFDQANAIWRDLKKTYGDAVALRRAKARWAEVRAHVTGSRVGAVGNLEVSNPGAGTGDASNPSNPRLTTGVEQKVSGATAKLAASPIKGFSINNSASTTPGEATGGHGVDGSVAYRRLWLSDDPYDPKLKGSIGTATVGPLTPVKEGVNPSAADTPDADQRDR